jgi:hypothetical protein
MGQSWIGNKDLPTSLEFSVPRPLNNGADAQARNSVCEGLAAVVQLSPR